MSDFPHVFFRQFADRSRQTVPWENQFGGTGTSSCWLIGGGPSLAELPVDDILTTPIPRMTTNLAGSGLLRPTFWTSYDPTVRFHRSVYLDPGVMKFVHPRRAMDLVPETTFKVCDCPNLYCFETDKQRGFADFLSLAHPAIVDWNDTFVQAIDILFRLGFREILLAGCEMIVRPSAAWREAAEECGVKYQRKMLLKEFARQCEQAGMTREEIEKLDTAGQYHFDERKSLQAAIDTDLHYFRIAQALRLCRRALALAGVRPISVTPESRLNDYFPYEPAGEACRRLMNVNGDPRAETTSGLYTQTQDRTVRGLGPMRDYRPQHWNDTPPAKPQPVRHGEFVEERAGWERRAEVRRALEQPGDVEIQEEG